MRRAISALVMLLSACVDTGQTRVALPLYLAGSDLSAPLTAAGGLELEIERAELAFGPLYLCAGNTAGELCDTARLEWLDSRVIDLTRSAPALAGELTGVSGTVRSFMYDLGISSQLTRGDPFMLEAAKQLDGASFRVAGSALLNGARVPFSAELAVQQGPGTEQGVPVIRKSVSESFEHDVGPNEAGLLVRFDAASWLSTLELRSYVRDTTCVPDGPSLACEGSVEHSCASDGSVATSRDCAALGQTCLAAEGCTSELHFEESDEAYRALRNALLVGERPTFTWGFLP
ncbi:MAG TPA: hypothetical protein VFN67_01295 [Polyangiales bacterium]|nr:hypothetical protein [Polyangiales bacterium]